MLYREIADKIENFYKKTPNALLVTGARQTGKTFSIRKFGEKFKSFIEINFIENPLAANTFKDVRNPKDILLRISALTDKPLIPGETLIFFDEVQECPDITTAIKFLVQEGSYRYILSGSLLGVELKDVKSEPVGYMGVMEMYPLTFREFVVNLGVNTAVLDHVRESFGFLKPIDDVIHNKLMELYRLYIVVGGMPAAVCQYIETNNLREVIDIQLDIVALYRRDITKYADRDQLRIKEIFDLIPSELNNKNKRFILKSLNQHAKFDRYKDSFLWLADAGVAIPVYNVEEPKVPLRLSECRNLFKFFSNDVGLLTAQYADGIQLRIISGDSSINYGAVYENAVAQELVAGGFRLYYFNSKRQGELDFVVEHEGGVLPIEVKSGKDYVVHRALNNVLLDRNYGIKKALVLSGHNLRVDGKVVYAPIYVTMFLTHRSLLPERFAIDLGPLK